MYNMSNSFQFSYFTYDVASRVRDHVNGGYGYDDLFLLYEEEYLYSLLNKFSKDTILHRFIFSTIYWYYSKDFRKNSDNYFGFYDVEPIALELLFDQYNVKRTKFKSYAKKQKIKSADGKYSDLLSEWFTDQAEAFDNLWERVTGEVFHLLFWNRKFLLDFNLGLTDHIYGDHEHLNKKDRIKRIAIPSWVRKAVYYRDHGRCVFCHKDLSGIVSTDRKLHYDHMIPLAVGGVNDPTNIQLLCEKCNLSKSDTEIRTNNVSPKWW